MKQMKTAEKLGENTMGRGRGRGWGLAPTGLGDDDASQCYNVPMKQKYEN